MAKVATGQQMRSAERLLSVLASFSSAAYTRSIAEISRDLDLSAATVRRLLITLESHGFLTHDATRGTYTLGHEVVRLASVALTGSSLVSAAAPHISRLNESLNETVQLTIRDRSDLIVIDTRASTHTLKAFHTVGHRYPAFKGGAAGLALLADLAEEELLALLPDPSEWPETTEAAPKSFEDLAPLLETTRAHGYGTNEGFTGSGVWAVAAPIRNASGAAIAAVNVPCPATRVAQKKRRSEVVKALLDCTAKISEASVFIR